jgi:hypothetical protein
LWRFNLLNILSDYQVDIITGLSSRPEASDPLYTTWCAENDVLRSVIASSIGNLYHVLDTSTRDAAKHYARLCQRFAPNDLESQYRTVSAFFELKLESATRSAWDTYEADYNKYVYEIEKSDLSLSDLFTLKNFGCPPRSTTRHSDFGLGSRPRSVGSAQASSFDGPHQVINLVPRRRKIDRPGCF